METAPRNCRFLSLVVVELVLREVAENTKKSGISQQEKSQGNKNTKKKKDKVYTSIGQNQEYCEGRALGVLLEAPLQIYSKRSENRTLFCSNPQAVTFEEPVKGHSWKDS